LALRFLRNSFNLQAGQSLELAHFANIEFVATPLASTDVDAIDTRSIYL